MLTTIRRNRDKLYCFLLFAAVLIGCVPMSLWAEGTLDREVSIADNLLIHYDFEENEKGGVLDDKAGNVNSSLAVVTAGFTVTEDGKIPEAALADEETVQNHFLFHDGTVSFSGSSRTQIAMATGITSDTQAIQAPGSGTWYFRLKLANGFTILNFRKNPAQDSRPIYLYYENSAFQSAVINGASAATSSQVDVGADVWVDLAIVRTYDAGNQNSPYRYSYQYRGFDGGWQEVLTIGCQTLDSSEDVILSLFAECCNGQELLGWCAPGSVYDDVRYYNTALTAEELSGIADVLAETDPYCTIHYDFEENEKGGVLSDKAGAVKTDLSVVSSGFSVNTDGSIAGALSLADQTYFSFADGAVQAAGSTGAKQTAALVTGITEDTKAIQMPGSSGTWFLRVRYTGIGWEPLITFRKGKNAEEHRPYFLQAENGVLGAYVNNGSQFKSADGIYTTDNYANGDWLNLAVVRTYTGKDYNLRYYYLIGDSGTWTEISMDYSVTALDTAEDVISSLFAEFNAWNNSASNSCTAGMTYDDFRYYSIALDTNQLTHIVSEVKNGEAQDPSPAVPDAITVLGAQRSTDDAADGTYRVRLIAQINGEAEEYRKAGLMVTAASGDWVSKPTELKSTTAYRSLLADGEMKPILADDGCFLIAVVIDGIPAEAYDSLTFTVTPYVTDIAGITEQGRTAEIRLENDAIVSAAWMN